MTTDPAARRLLLSAIRIDPAVQSRADGLDEATVEEYAELMRAGVAFPPVRVFRSQGGTLWLAQGFHRAEAARRAGLTEIAAEVAAGERDDAAFDSACANAAHGLRRTNRDKRRAAEAALQLRPGWSDHSLAAALGVSQPFVGKVRSQVITAFAPVRTGRDGKTYAVPGAADDDGPGEPAGRGVEATGEDSPPAVRDGGPAPGPDRAPPAPAAAAPLDSADRLFRSCLGHLKAAAADLELVLGSRAGAFLRKATAGGELLFREAPPAVRGGRLSAGRWACGYLAAVAAAVRKAAPDHACPCGGAGCGYCADAGFIPKGWADLKADDVRALDLGDPWSAGAIPLGAE